MFINPWTSKQSNRVFCAFQKFWRFASPPRYERKLSTLRITLFKVSGLRVFCYFQNFWNQYKFCVMFSNLLPAELKTWRLVSILILLSHHLKKNKKKVNSKNHVIPTLTAHWPDIHVKLWKQKICVRWIWTLLILLVFLMRRLNNGAWDTEFNTNFKIHSFKVLMRSVIS